MRSEDITKPTSKMFKPVTEDAYRKAFKQLEELRERYPGYRDDEYLMFASACVIMALGVMDPMDVIVQRAAASLLRQSFMDIQEQYEGLTKSEKNLITEEEFEGLLLWIERHAQPK